MLYECGAYKSQPILMSELDWPGRNHLGLITSNFAKSLRTGGEQLGLDVVDSLRHAGS